MEENKTLTKDVSPLYAEEIHMLEGLEDEELERYSTDSSIIRDNICPGNGGLLCGPKRGYGPGGRTGRKRISRTPTSPGGIRS